MPFVEFKFDIDKDLWNIWASGNYESTWSNPSLNMNPKVLEIVRGKDFESCKEELKNYFKKIHNSPLIPISLEALKKAWITIEDEFFKRIQILMDRSICIDNIIGYLTTAGRCPYNPEEDWFMVSLFMDIPRALATIGHEIMHLQFHHYYWEGVSKEIGEANTADLKEALTVLLNSEFNDLWFVNDKGYEIHKDLRDFITKTWKDKKDFKSLLNNCISYIKSQ